MVVESVYSMDGDFAPLKEIAALCKQYDAGLIVDEAHATGVYGNRGEGLVGELGIEDACDHANDEEQQIQQHTHVSLQGRRGPAAPRQFTAGRSGTDFAQGLRWRSMRLSITSGPAFAKGPAPGMTA